MKTIILGNLEYYIPDTYHVLTMLVYNYNTKSNVKVSYLAPIRDTKNSEYYLKKYEGILGKSSTSCTHIQNNLVVSPVLDYFYCDINYIAKTNFIFMSGGNATPISNYCVSKLIKNNVLEGGKILNTFKVGFSTSNYKDIVLIPLDIIEAL
jgi:hypothetical protein